MALEALLVDFGGTLATEAPSRGALYARSARARGVEVTDDGMARLMGAAHAALPRVVDGRPRYSDAWFRRFIERVFHGALGLPREALPEVERELFARFSDAASFRVFPGARRLLEDARTAGLRTALVSNWSEHLEELTRALGLREHLDLVVSSAVVGHEKPEPEIFRVALDGLGVAPAAALHAGNDRTNDVEGAQAVGVAAVLVDHAGAAPGRMDPGALRVHGLDDLRELVLARTRTP